MADDKKSNSQILQALLALSHAHTLYQAHAAARRTTSLAIPRSADSAYAVPAETPCPLSRRLSLMSPFQSWSKLDKYGKDDDTDDGEDQDDTDDGDDDAQLKRQSFAGMQRVGYLFSVEVVAAQGLPPSMNGLLLTVVVRQKESRDGAVQSMPVRVQKGAADFNETLYVQCHLYCSGGGGTGKLPKFEPQPFILSVVAVDAAELNLGQTCMDFSAFVNEFTDKCQQGLYPRQWDATFPLAGKAKGGDLVVKLAFQIMEGLGLVVNSQLDAREKTTYSSWSSSFAHKMSKSSSFIVISAKMLRSKLLFMPKMGVFMPDLKNIDNFKLDEPTPTTDVKVAALVEREVLKHKPEQVKVGQLKEATEPKLVGLKEEEEHKESKPEPELELEEAKEEQKELEPQPKVEDEKSIDSEQPEFDVVDMGIEGQEEIEADKALEVMVLNTVSDATIESVEQPDDNGEEVTKKSQQLSNANGEVVTVESLLPRVANEEEVTGEQQTEDTGQEVTKDFLQMSLASAEEVTREYVQPPEANRKEETEESLQLLEANEVEFIGASLQPKEMEEVKMLKLKLLFKPKMDMRTSKLKEVDNSKDDEPTPMAEVRAATLAEQKESERMAETVEPELAVFKEGQEEQKAPKHELEPVEAKEEEEEQKESEPTLETEEEKSDDSELLEFDVVDKSIEGQEEAEIEKALEEMLGAMSDAATPLVEQLVANMEEVIGESLQPPKVNRENVTREQPLEANKEGVIKEPMKPSKPNGEAVTEEPLQPYDVNGEEVIKESLQSPEPSQEGVSGDSMQPPEPNMEEMTRELPEANREEVTTESLQPPKSNGKDLTVETLQPPETNMEEVTRESLQPSEANRKEVIGDSLQLSEQGEVKVAGAKSSPRRIRWQTLAIIVTPLAVIVSKALVRRKQWLNLSLELRCHVVSRSNQSPHHHFVQNLLECDLQCTTPNR